MPLAEDRSLSHYSIFCGPFHYSKYSKSDAWIPWQGRLSDPGSFVTRLSRTYHAHFINQILDESGDGILQHETFASAVGSPIPIELGGFKFQINWIDRYLFPGGHGLFAIHVQSVHDVSYPSIGHLISRFREADSTALLDAQSTTIRELIHKALGTGVILKTGWDRNMDRLKHFTNINDGSSSVFEDQHNHLLFELGHAMPLGSVKAANSQSPSQEYYQTIFAQNGLSPFANWKALALLDSFTRISTSFPDETKAWEDEFFHIYLYCLQGKYFLSNILNKYNQGNLDKKQSRQLKESFLSFASQYATSNISPKFLSNAIHEKMVTGLGLEDDLADVAKKISWIEQLDEGESQGQRLNSRSTGSELVPGFTHDIFISFQQDANNAGWVSDFITAFRNEIASLFKEKVVIYYNHPGEPNSQEDVRPDINTLVFIPILSHTYINPKSEVWNDEIVPFCSRARADKFGLQVRLKNGNVANRIIPVLIHDLDDDDWDIYKEALGIDIRGVDFIYSEPGVNRPLDTQDDPRQNLNKTSYRNQINKLANAVKELVKGMKELKGTSS